VEIPGQFSAEINNHDGLFVFYQPIVDIKTHQVTAREALVRWHHPERGWVSPVEFIPVAETSGLIDKVGAFVLDRACRDAAGWDGGIRVAVNISACQLGKGTLAPVVSAALRASGLSPDRLEIEVTETALLADEDETIADLRQVRDMGVRVALDDFGTGYSSLSHLRIFPFDKIKIDGSFVRDAVDRPDCAAVVKAVADLGQRLGVTTVAEGVETEAHLDRIRAEGCTEVQGYVYGRPVPNDSDAPLVAALNEKSRRTAAA
jgi:predicted signal transduction protein with EAL and GGDEF domain